VPRKVRDSSLESRSARSRLPVRHKPYFRLIEPGLHLGYRKLTSGPGTWIKRRYVDQGKYVTENLRTATGVLVLADDYEDADGVRILSFAQAQQAARGPRGPQRSGDAYTIADAVDDYLRFLESDGRSARAVQDARYRAQALILPKLGKIKITSLVPERLRHWRDDIAVTPARLRTGKGEEQQYRAISNNEETRRQRRVSANRTWTTLRAVLNHAFRDGKIDNDAAWRKVRPFQAVDTARIHYLTIAEAKRLINACDPDFRRLVQAALQTGCRYGELCRLEAHDFNPDSGTLAIRKSKSGKPRHVVLTDEGRAFFAQLIVGRSGSEPVLGKMWGPSHQIKRMREACEHAKIKPAVSFHVLRHTWASHAVMGGMPLMVVAKNLGHSDTRMVERHYGHLAPDFVADAIRKTAPKFGFKPDKRIAAI
jgi:integrase